MGTLVQIQLIVYRVSLVFLVSLVDLVYLVCPVENVLIAKNANRSNSLDQCS